MIPTLSIHPIVQQALQLHQPVVALESTIISHGMPYPQNLHNAHALEQQVIQNNAIPATIAVISGIPYIGLTSYQLILLSTNKSVKKLSKRDLPLAFANKSHGATTVSATLFLASLANIQVFATGGIGGVHRYVTQSWDISSDIIALANSPLITICSGVKSILDIDKTLQALETAAVPVLVLNNSSFPAFYTRDSSFPSPAVVSDERHAALIFAKSLQVDKTTGMLLAVPVPIEYQADAQEIEHATQQALEKMKGQVLPTNQVTPFLLKEIASITNGRSLQANMMLARNNAAVAARVAVQLVKLQADKRGINSLVSQNGIQQKQTESSNVQPAMKQTQRNCDLLIVGATALDIHCQVQATTKLSMRVSNQGRVQQQCGGVGKNIAEAAARLGRAQVCFVSAVGEDPTAGIVLDMLKKAGVPVEGVQKVKGKRTPVICVVHDHLGDLAVGVADLNDMFTSTDNDAEFSLVQSSLLTIREALTTARLAIFDGNSTVHDMNLLTKECMNANVKCWFEPTTMAKSVRIIQAKGLGRIWVISPNEDELCAMANAVYGKEVFNSKEEWNESLLKNMSYVLLKHAYEENKQEKRKVGLNIICTRGTKGVLHVWMDMNDDDDDNVYSKSYDAVIVKEDEIRNTTGAGDCFAGVAASVITKGGNLERAIRAGIQAGAACVRSERTVPFIARL